MAAVIKFIYYNYYDWSKKRARHLAQDEQCKLNAISLRRMDLNKILIDLKIEVRLTNYPLISWVSNSIGWSKLNTVSIFSARCHCCPVTLNCFAERTWSITLFRGWSYSHFRVRFRFFFFFEQRRKKRRGRCCYLNLTVTWKQKKKTNERLLPLLNLDSNAVAKKFPTLLISLLH